MRDRIQSAVLYPDPEVVDRLEHLIIDVVTGIDDGRDCTEQIAAINALSGEQNYDKETFFKLYSWTSEREFAELAAMGPPPKIPDLTSHEIVECLRIVKSADEPKASFCRGILEQSYPTVPITDLIYYPDEERDDFALAKEILDRASKPNTLRF